MVRHFLQRSIAPVLEAWRSFDVGSGHGPRAVGKPLTSLVAGGNAVKRDHTVKFKPVLKAKCVGTDIDVQLWKELSFPVSSSRCYCEYVTGVWFGSSPTPTLLPALTLPPHQILRAKIGSTGRASFVQSAAFWVLQDLIIKTPNGHFVILGKWERASLPPTTFPPPSHDAGSGTPTGVALPWVPVHSVCVSGVSGSLPEPPSGIPPVSVMRTSRPGSRRSSQKSGPSWSGAAWRL